MPDDDAQPDPPIRTDLPCLNCGYSLRGLDVHGRCPECGVHIADSIRYNRNKRISDLLRTIGFGYIYLLASILYVLLVVSIIKRWRALRELERLCASPEYAELLGRVRFMRHLIGFESIPVGLLLVLFISSRWFTISSETYLAVMCLAIGVEIAGLVLAMSICASLARILNHVAILRSIRGATIVIAILSGLGLLTTVGGSIGAGVSAWTVACPLIGIGLILCGLGVLTTFDLARAIWSEPQATI